MKTLSDRLTDGQFIVDALGIEDAISVQLGTNYDVPAYQLWPAQLIGMIDKSHRRFYSVTKKTLDGTYVVVVIGGRTNGVDWQCELLSAGVPADMMVVIERLIEEAKPASQSHGFTAHFVPVAAGDPGPGEFIDPFAGLGGSTVSHEVVAERGDVVAVAPADEPLPQPAVDEDDRPW